MTSGTLDTYVVSAANSILNAKRNRAEAERELGNLNRQTGTTMSLHNAMRLKELKQDLQNLDKDIRMSSNELYKYLPVGVNVYVGEGIYVTLSGSQDTRITAEVTRR